MSLLQDKYPFLSFERKDDILSLKDILPQKFCRNGRLVSLDGSLFDISLREEHRILMSGMQAIVLDIDISHHTNNETSRYDVDGVKCLVYTFKRRFDLFGKVNVFCDEKNTPKYIHLVGNKETIVSEKFEGQTFLNKEPIALTILPYQQIKLMLEYDEFPEKDPEIICDTYVVSGYIRKMLLVRPPYYSESYKFYYDDGTVKGSI